VAEHGTRTRVLLIGGDARTLRALRVFLDTLGVFEAVAVATGGAGLNALTRQPWAAVILVDDLHDMRPEEVMASARQAGVHAAILALNVSGDRSRAQALDAGGAAEVVALGATPTPEIARALGRAIERQSLVNRIEVLEAELSQRRPYDEATGLYPRWRFDEDWRLEQVRARRRRGHLSMLTVSLEVIPDIIVLPERDRLTLLRQAGRIIKSVLRDGDVASHDGSGRFRVLLPDSDLPAAADLAARLSIALRAAMAGSPIPGAAAVHLAEAFEDASSTALAR
jgi:PleD family two-component response regulator